jgi:hypothetical protein
VEQGADYTETLTPPLSWWAMGAALVATVFWCFVVATPLLPAVIAAAVAALVVGLVLARYAVAVSTDAAGLHAGVATLPWRNIGAVQPLDADETHRLLGVGADATAYLVTRSYCRGAVKVSVDDDRDPTPYWVVSTRHPDLLASHLRARSMRD